MVARRPSPRTQSVLTILAIVGVAFAGLLSEAPRTSATTYVSGPINVDTTWGVTDTTYVVTKHVTVTARATLTILPKTTVKFDPGMALFVEGRLYADGQIGAEITFTANSTILAIPWLGVQFNASSVGSVTWSIFDRVERAVTALDSSPTISFNTIRQAGIGVALVRSSATVYNNTVLRASAYGIYLNQSDAWVSHNTLNNTFAGILAEWFGFPDINANTVTNGSGSFTAGIWLQKGVGASVWYNQIRGMRGSLGLNGAAAGASGAAGGTAVGVLVTDAPFATINGNTVDTILGGRGGNGADNPGGTGGAGGPGGASVGIIVSKTPVVDIESNTIFGLAGGRGGNGGTSAVTTNGGRGGDAGAAIAYYVLDASFSTYVAWNTADAISGGVGGNGGVAATSDGSGGNGGDAVGASLWNAVNAYLLGNMMQNVRGGPGGNSSLTGTGRASGEGGGDAGGITAISVAGAQTRFESNDLFTLRGGNGGRGQTTGGPGGNATGIFVLGNADGMFNRTSAGWNRVQGVTAGNGGIGQRRGGNGGTAGGISMLFVTLDTWTNDLSTFVAGAGGDALDGTDGGRGGDATGLAAALVPSGSSAGDTISSVSKGPPGTGPPIQTSYGTGVFLAGSAAITTRVTVENGTLQLTGDRDFWVLDYADGTTINTPFNGGKIQIDPAGNLTVRNYLAIEIYQPDGLTPLGGANVLVADDGNPVWNQVSPSGFEQWLLVTDRVYINSNTPRDNRTDITITYGSESFTSNPRQVDMATSRTEKFVMIDGTAPASAASPLPAYQNTWNFSVTYTASDGGGVGVSTVELYYKWNGGGWILFGTQFPGPGGGSFAFTGSGDGVYEFATVAEDLNGNRESGPGNFNDTWTIVDTVRPGSHVNPLPTYRTTPTFLVTWAPDSGVTDIARYEVQYNRGAGWQTWLSGTTQTSAPFPAPGDGLYQFRSKATDNAGNVEIVPATNDTWTIVDTQPPFTATSPLPVWQTSSSFTVQWSRESDDVATYTIQVRDNGGSWTDWVTVPVATTSGVYTGAQDGHTYEFRSIGTDLAGNVQPAPAGNQSWTKVDLSPPNSAVATLPPYETAALFSITWGPVSGTTDIATYTVEVSDNNGLWTQVPGAVGTTATSTTFVGTDGHRYAFRSLAMDRAGNAEPAPAANDTWTIMDLTRPTVLTGSPRGAGTDILPTITVTFSEPMDRTSAEQAFTIQPDMNGAFSWSSDSRVMTFTPARALLAGTDYTIFIDSSARDAAGNSMVNPYSFQFATAGSPVSALGDWIWIIGVLIAATLGGAGLFLYARHRSAAKAVTAAKEEAVIDDVFLLYNDGLLIKHETRRLKPDVDSDILSGMLTAVQQFVKDSFRSEDAELNEMTFGQMHILLGRGKWLILAAIIGGDGVDLFTAQIKRAIEDMENHHWDQLEGWNGDMAIAKVLAPYVKKLIRGDYARPTQPGSPPKA